MFDGADISDSESDSEEKVVKEKLIVDVSRKTKPKGGISLFGGAIEKNFFKVKNCNFCWVKLNKSK